MLDIVRFENPRILWLLLLLVPMVAYYVYRTLQGRAAIQVSTVSGLLKLRHTYRYWLRHAPFVLRLLVVALVIFAASLFSMFVVNTVFPTQHGF